MENKNLRKRLYQNLSQRPLKHTFLLETETADPKSPQGVLKPKILQESASQLKLSSSFVSLTPNLFKSPEPVDKKKIKPQKVQLQKLSKEAKSIVQDNKNKIRSNLKPDEIFAFYDTFPEMIEDFFYLNRVSHPYDYQIVSYAKRNPHEYMTISSQGVTLYHDKQAEFLTREQWLEDEKTYFKLQKIDFFNQYKISKNFLIWKNRMKRHYMKSMSNILCEKLFLTYEHPRRCLKQVRGFSLSLEESLSLFPSEQMQPSNWQQLLDAANKYHASALICRIDQFQQKIIKSLQQAIQLQIKNFKQNNKIKIQGLNTKQQNKQGYVYSQEAILRKQYKRILKFIKLAESVLLQSKLQLIKRWLVQLLEKLKQVNENSLREDWLTFNFVALPPEKNSREIKWIPTQQNFVTTFTKIIGNAVHMICQKHQKVINSEKFQKYRSSEDQTMNKDDRHNSLKNLIEQSEFYNSSIAQIEEKMQKQFQYVLKQEQELKKFIDIYIKHKEMASLESIIQESSAAEISSLAREWKLDNQQMQDLPDRCLGMIKFDYSLMRKSMMNVAHESFTGMFSLLPSHLSRMCQQTQKKVSGLLRPILMVPTDSNFVQFTKSVKKASQELESIIQTDKEIKQLLMLLQEYKIPNLQSHKANIKSLSSLITDLKNKVNEAEAMQNQRLLKFKKDIEVTIKKIKTNVKEYMAKLQQIEFDQKQLPADSIIEKINSILPTIEDLDKQATNIKMIQSELSLTETDLSEAHTLFNRTQVLNNLWNQKKFWNEFKQILYSTHYCDLDYELNLQKWQEFNEKISKIKTYLQDNDFVNEIELEINEVETQIQLVKTLQSKSLNEKSWNEISEYLAFELERQQNQSQAVTPGPFSNPKDAMYTVEWLKQNNICKYKEKIEFIVKKSEKQSYLTNLLSVLKNYINNLNLQFVTKKRQLILLGDNTVVFQELSQHLDCLLQILGQQYSDSLMRQTKALAKHYEYVIEILEAYRDFGKNWEKYEDLFDPSKHHSKQLSKQSKDFGNLEASWKKLIKNITMENWSKKMYDESSGNNPNKNTLKAIYKTFTIWDQIIKGIQQFLDRRRNVFHHYFYFTDDELLSLMVQSEMSINSIIPSIYDNIKAINLSKDSDMLLSVVNSDGEELKINKGITIKIGSQLEEILKNCEQQWKKTLITTIKKVFSDFVSLNDDEVNRKKIILENNTQIVTAFDHIIWVKLAEETYLCSEPLGTLSDWINIQNGQIQQFYQLLSTSISPLQQKKITQMLVQALYLRDKTEHFLKTNTKTLDSYEWERTLKLCDGVGNLHEKIYLKTFGETTSYGGQFYGPSNTAFITPQTERNYLNLIQCIHSRQISVISNNSNNIQTIKSLSYLLAQNFKTFSFCSGVSLRMIDRVLAGICIQGLWSCLSVPNNSQIISFLASRLSVIQKFIEENNTSIQFGRYSAVFNQSNLPVFFLRASYSQMQHIQKTSRCNFRSISLVAPNVKKILQIKSEVNDKSGELGQIISEITQHCNQLLSQSVYDEFSLDFAQTILNQFFNRGYSTSGNVSKKVVELFQRILSPKLKMEDQNALANLFQAYNIESDQKLKTKRFLTNQDIASSKLLFIDENMPSKYGDIVAKDASNLYETMTQTWSRNKKIVLVGQRFHGKTSIIDHVKTYIETIEKKQIKVSQVYYEAFKSSDLLSVNQKSPGIIAKCLEGLADENWIVLDGPLNQKYFQILKYLSNESIISNYGVLRDGLSSTKLRIFLQTTDLSNVDPGFVNEHSVLYIEQKSGRVEEILRSSLQNFLYKTYEEETRMQLKNDETQHEVKAYREKKKQLTLSKETIQLLVSQVSGLIEKFATKGSVRIKSVELLYEITTAQLAYKCSKLIESVLIESWSYFKDKDKVSRKVIEKFALWVVIWSIYTLVNPEDKEKFQKVIAELTKTSFNDDILNSIVYPGSGFELSSLNSQRVQNIFSCVPIPGNILNIINRYNALFEGEAPKNKSKYEQQFYFDDPHNIRVVTRDSVLFSYFFILNKHNKMPIAIYGPPSSGKKSLIDIFNKGNEEKVQSYPIRFKRHDAFYLGKQFQKPFIRLEASGKSYFKPLDNSRIVHISIDDLAMLPQAQPSTQFLRMFINKNSTYDDKANEVFFRQYLLSMTIGQIKDPNYENVDFKRVLSRMFMIQSSKISKDKLYYIFNPILDNLCCDFWTIDNEEKVRAFNNKNGDNILVQATVSIYNFIDNLVSGLPCQKIEDRNKKLLMVPKIKQICKTVANICKMESSQVLQMENCAQLWAHEVLRVFGDKFSNQQHRQALISEIKKYSFMHFKHHISINGPGFIFTNLWSQQEEKEDKNAEKPYIKCEDLGEIEKQIQKIYEKENFTLPAPIITDEFIQQLVKVYRVLKMQSGHLLIATPFKKSAKYLIKIACLFTKQSVYHDIEHGVLDADLHIAPAIMRDINTCFILNTQTATEETLYQVACLMNRNLWQFEFKPQIKDKIREKFVTIAQESLNKESQSTKISTFAKTKLSHHESMLQDTLKLVEIQNKIQQEFYSIAIDGFSEHLHVACCILPYSVSTTRFINENMAIVKNMQVIWYEFKDEVLFSTGQRMMEQLYADKEQNKPLLGKCQSVYSLLTHEQKGEADFLKFLSCCNRTYEIASEELTEQIKVYQDCLESLNKNTILIAEQKNQSETIQHKIEELVRTQQDISHKIKMIEENNEEGLQKYEAEMKKIKAEKDSLDLKSRELRTSEKICQDFEKLLPNKEELSSKLEEIKDVKRKIQQYSILIESALSYLNNAQKDEYITEFNRWVKVLGLKPVEKISQVLQIFEKTLGAQYVKVPGWQKYSQFTQLKGIHFCQNFMSIPQSIFGSEPIVVKDDECLLANLLSSIGEKNPSLNVYSNCKLISHIQNGRQKENTQKTGREVVFGMIEKQVQRVISQSKGELKNESKEMGKSEDMTQLSKGIIIVGNNYNWQPNRNDIEIFEKRMLRDKKINMQNRIIVQGIISPNITFYPDVKDFKCMLAENSKRIQFGESFVNQNTKVETFLKEIAIKLDRRNQDLIKACTVAAESPQKNLQPALKIQNQITEIDKAKKKALSMIPEEYKSTADYFLIDWFIETSNRKVNEFGRLAQVYEFVKKCLLELNYGKEKKALTVEEIQPEMIKNWTSLIKSNLSEGTEIPIEELAKFLMQIQRTPNLVLIPHQCGVQSELKVLQHDSSYSMHFIDMHLSTLPETLPSQQKTKNMYILSNFVPQSNSHHLLSFIQHFDKCGQNYCPVTIIISDDCQNIAKNKLIKDRFRIIFKKIHCTHNKTSLLDHFESEQASRSRKTILTKVNHKNTMEQNETNADPTPDESNNEQKIKLREKIRKLLVILTESKKNVYQHLSNKVINERIKLIANVNEAQTFIQDCIHDLPNQWNIFLSYLNQSNTAQDLQSQKQIEEIFEKYQQLRQTGQIKIQEGKHEDAHVKEFVINPKIQEIQDRIDRLPFSFNCHDFTQTNQPFSIEIANKARQFNKQRYFLKKHLQQCIKVIKGSAIHYWDKSKEDFGFWLPTIDFINKINNDYKTIKKGLEAIGLISSIDVSTKQIKLINSGGLSQAQPILTIATQSFDYKNIEGVSERLLLTAAIKASKKLKIPLTKLKKTWRLITSDGTVQQTVNGELCLSLNGHVQKQELLEVNKALLSKQPKTVKLLLMLYDPTPLPAQIQQLPKQQSKKDKLKKTKLEKTFTNSSEKEELLSSVPIKLHNGKNIGVIQVPLAQQNLKYKVIAEQPCFTLF